MIASNYIYGDTVAKTLSTNAGDVVLASDSDGSGFGNIDIYNGLTIDTRAIASGSTKSTALTGGGNVTLGGGNAAGTGYASGVDSNRAEGIRVNNGFYIRSGGGNISLRGRSWSGAVATDTGAFGVGIWGSGGEFVADAGTGAPAAAGASAAFAAPCLGPVLAWPFAAPSLSVGSCFALTALPKGGLAAPGGGGGDLNTSSTTCAGGQRQDKGRV